MLSRCLSVLALCLVALPAYADVDSTRAVGHISASVSNLMVVTREGCFVQGELVECGVNDNTAPPDDKLAYIDTVNRWRRIEE